MRTTYLAVPVAAALVLTAPLAHSDDSLFPMQQSAVQEATEALRRAQAEEALAHTAESLANQSGAVLSTKHDDHSGETVWLVPYAPLSLNPQGFYSFENAKDFAQTARILLVGDSGRLLRGADITVPAGQLTHINSQDILNGNPGRSVTTTVVAQPRKGEDAWAFVTTPPYMWVRAYARTPGGFVTGMSDTLERYISGTERAVEHATFFNPGSNRGIVSVLRILNAVDRPRTAIITGDDARGVPSGIIRCRIGGNQALMLSARVLEEGPSGCSGRLGDGTGKWRLFIYPENVDDFWFSSMSQLWGAVGVVTNVSFPEPYHFSSP